MMRIEISHRPERERVKLEYTERADKADGKFARLVDVANGSEKSDKYPAWRGEAPQGDGHETSLRHHVSYTAIVLHVAPDEGSDVGAENVSDPETTKVDVEDFEHAEAMTVARPAQVISNLTEAIEGRSGQAQSTSVVLRQPDFVFVSKRDSSIQQAAFVYPNAQQVIEKNSSGVGENALPAAVVLGAVSRDDMCAGKPLAGVTVRTYRSVASPINALDVWMRSSTMDASSQQRSSLHMHSPISRLEVAVLTEASGRIDLRLELSDSGLNVDFLTDSVGSSLGVEKEVPAMREALHAAGYDTGRIDVRTGRLDSVVPNDAANWDEKVFSGREDRNFGRRSPEEDEEDQLEPRSGSGSSSSSLLRGSKFV